MTRLSLLLLLLPVVALADEVSRGLWKNHTARVRSFACLHQPQERVVTLEELGIEQSSSHNIKPAASVLHRCDHNPVCCGDGPVVWTAVESSPVELVFRFEDKVNGSSDLTFRTVSTMNHTRCACQEPKKINRRSILYVLGRRN